MSASAQNISRMTRPAEKLKKPRPLKIQNQNRHSTIDARLGTLEEIMFLAETVGNNLVNGNYDRSLQTNIISLNSMLKSYGSKLEAVYKDQLDRAFVTFRNGCRDESLDYISRLHLLELIELRATNWVVNESNNYYKHKYTHQDVEVMPINQLENSMSSPNIYQNTQISALSPVTTQSPLLLAPGELVKSSGKFAAPTKIPGKNYCKDEVVIRNSDSGKVMGIKGRRVHMIEELSETVISFQRVNQGAKERLVQITGPTEEKIIYAKQLMEETIRRNASPVRSEMPDKERLGSSSSLNSSTSDDSLRYRNSSSKRSTLLHSFSTSDAHIGEYKYTVTVGEDSLKITGSNLDLVRVAKLVLDEYFGTESNEQFNEYSFEEENVVFEPARSAEPILRVNSQDSEESEETYKVQQTKVPTEIKKSTSFKNFSPVETKNEFEVEEADEAPIIFDEVPPLTADEARVLNETAEWYQKKRGFLKGNNESVNSLPEAAKPELASKNIISYTCEELIHFADSPLSRRVPKNWANVIKEFPTIVKKLPVEWFDSKSYSKKRLQEADAMIAIQSLSETGSPETE